MLPSGKYVVEIVVPPGMELVKEEDKNILIGDNYIAPVTQQFGGAGQHLHHPRPGLGGVGRHEAGRRLQRQQCPKSDAEPGRNADNSIVPGFVPEPTWPCVGTARIVPDYISLFPQSHAGRAVRRRHPQPVRSQGSHAWRSEGRHREVLRVHLDPHRVQVHRRHHGRLHLRVRSVLAAVRREVRAAQSADLGQGLDRQRDQPRVRRPVGSVQRHDVLDLGSESAESHRLFAER